MREAWPEVQIVFRADSGFCRHHMLGWCDKNGINYIVGIAKNNRLLEMPQPLIDKARYHFDPSCQKRLLFGDLLYAAGSWKSARRIIAKAEHSRKRANPRFVVTNLSGDGTKLYERVYCDRGDAENRIKEQQLDLFADRTS